MDISYHCVADDHEMSAMINNRRFQDVSDVDDQEIIELVQSKSKIRLDVPVIVGMFVLDYAKLLMLNFYYRFLIKHIPQTNFCLIQTDTDSVYMAFSEESMFLAVPKANREQFMKEYAKWFAVEYCSNHEKKFFKAVFSNKKWQPCDKCVEMTLYDSKTVGKMHQEWVGKGVVALCSKAYWCIGTDKKYSSKGLSKVHNELSERDYKNVLLHQRLSKANNRGFRMKGDNMFTYQQSRRGLAYLYGKRIVLSDHKSTLPTHL